MESIYQLVVAKGLVIARSFHHHLPICGNLDAQAFGVVVSVAFHNLDAPLGDHVVPMDDAVVRNHDVVMDNAACHTIDAVDATYRGLGLEGDAVIRSLNVLRDELDVCEVVGDALVTNDLKDEGVIDLDVHMDELDLEDGVILVGVIDPDVPLDDLGVPLDVLGVPLDVFAVQLGVPDVPLGVLGDP